MSTVTEWAGQRELQPDNPTDLSVIIFLFSVFVTRQEMRRKRKNNQRINNKIFIIIMLSCEENILKLWLNSCFMLNL